MARRGRTPERGGELHSWTFDHCRDGKPKTGYVAGPLHWLLLHDAKPSKPCLVPLYGPGTRCPYCQAKHELYEGGYQPLRDMRGRAWVVLIRETHERVVSRLTPGQGCRWGRAEGKAQGCYVEPWPVTPEWDYWYPDMRPAADLSRWLPVLWGLRDLTAAVAGFFAAGDGGASDSPLSPSPDAPGESVPPELARIRREQQAGRAIRRDDGPARLGDVLPADRNGTH